MAKKRLLQALQEKNNLFNLIAKSLKTKDFNEAKKNFDILKPTEQHKLALASRLLCQITTDFTQKDIEILLKTFDINIKELRFQQKTNTNEEVSFTSTPIIMNLLNAHWAKNPKQATSLFKFFIKQGLRLQSKESYNNALIHVVTKYPNDLGFIEMLLKQAFLKNCFYGRLISTTHHLLIIIDISLILFNNN